MTSAFLFITWSMKPGILVREPVVILAPDVRGEQVVERGDGLAPGDPACDLQPLGVLVEHRVDDVDERLVAREQPVPPGQQIALEPALAGVLGEDLQHASVRRQPLVELGARSPSTPAPVTLQHRSEPVRDGLVGPDQPEVARVARCAP